METLKPLLKWAGGKTWLLPRLLELYAPFRETHVLIEPFVGSAAVALGLRPHWARLNDLCVPLVLFHQHIASGRTADWVYPDNTEDAFYAARQRFNLECISDSERASLFYYLNCAGFNGLCRFNSRGGFNVPYGKRKRLTLETDLTPWGEAMYPWAFTHGPWERALYAGGFVYADPPYDSTFVGYAGAGFTWDEQVRLAHALASYGGPVVASNSATERVLGLYRDLGFNVDTLEAPRRISCNGDRANALEMLATIRL